MDAPVFSPTTRRMSLRVEFLAMIAELPVQIGDDRRIRRHLFRRQGNDSWSLRLVLSGRFHLNSLARDTCEHGPLWGLFGHPPHTWSPERKPSHWKCRS